MLGRCSEREAALDSVGPVGSLDGNVDDGMRLVPRVLDFHGDDAPVVGGRESVGRRVGLDGRVARTLGVGQGHEVHRLFNNNHSGRF